MDTGKIIQDFLILRSANTQRRYLSALKNWQSFIAKDLLYAGPDDSLSYIANLKRRKLSDNSIANDFHALRSIYGLLVDMGRIALNPFRQTGRLINVRSRRQVRPTKMIPFEKVWKVINDGSASLEAVRDRAILACIFGGGLRRSEVFGLNVADFSNRNGDYSLYLRHTKAGKDVYQGLPSWAGELIARHAVNRMIGYGDVPMFTRIFANGSQSKDRLSVESIYRIYKSRLRSVSIDAGPHSGRATAISRLKDQGFEDREVAGFLRHATTRQVEIYDKRFRQALGGVAKMLIYPKYVLQQS